MKKPFFKPEDFKKIHDYYHTTPEALLNSCAYFANKKLNELIESMPVVYGKPLHPTNPYPEDLKRYQWSENRISRDTHKARLAFIEEIVKEPCLHEPYINILTRPFTTIECKHCGVELVATWSAK